MGMRAVRDVVMNRAKDWKFSVHDIIYAKNQFTSMSVPSDPQFYLEPSGGASWEMAQFIARDGSGDGITKGAHYYANLRTATSAWFRREILYNPREHPTTVEIGRHTFFV